MKSILLLFLTAFACHAFGAPITWTAPRDITADTDVSTNGTLVKAVSKAGSAYPTVNGVTFTPTYSGDSVSGVNASNASTIGAMPVGGGVSAAYATLLSQNDYNTGSASTVTLTVSGLTVGQMYEVQVWANDSDASSAGTQTVKSSGGLDSWALLKMNPSGTSGGKGQFALGTFTADAASQVITFQGSTNGMIQAYQVRRISDPLAAIVWDVWKETAGDSDVGTDGVPVRAYVFGSTAPAAAINGATFTRFASQAVDTLSGFTTPSSDAFGSSSAPFSALTSDYRKLLGGAASGGKSASLTLNGLTPGQWYSIQVWANDSRAAGAGRSERVNGSSFLNFNPGGPTDNPAYEGGLGHHMTGLFRAGAASQRLDFGADVSAQINGLQLRSIPAPDPLVFEARQRNQFTRVSYIDGKMTSSSRFEGVHLAFGSGQFVKAKADMEAASLWWGAGNGYTFDGFPAVDAVIRWKKYVNTASRNAIRDRLPTINYRTPGTSNLLKLAQTMRILGSQEFGEGAFRHPDNDWRPSDPSGRNWMVGALRSESQNGVSEFASNDYGMHNTLPSLSLSQLSTDPEVRAAGAASWPAFMSQMAAVWQPGEYYAGVWSSRSYEDQSGYYGVYGRMLWQALGSGGRSGDAKAMAIMAASGYVLPAPILRAANERTTSYTSRLYGGSAYQQAYVSGKDYILFSASDSRASGSGWSWGYGVRWKGMTNFFWLMGVATDNPADMAAASNHGKMQLDFDTMQHRDSVVYTFDKSHPLARDPRYAQAQVPGGYLAMINDSTTSGRIFLHYNKVMISVASDVPFTWDPNAGIYSPRATPQPGDSEFRVAVGGVGYPQNDPNFAANISATNNRFAMAIETSLPSEYPGATAADQLAAFRTALLATTSISHTDVTVSTYKITKARYVNRHGDVLEKESYNDDRTRRGGWINGTAVDYANWPALENPWMSQLRTGGKELTVTAGNQRVVLDYNNFTITPSTVPPAAATPEVSTLAPAGLTETSAVLAGEVLSTGTSATSVTVYWGTSDGGTTTGAWANNVPLGTQSLGQVLAPISGLTANTNYFVRHRATNAAGSVWSPATLTFKTLQSPPPPRPDGLSNTLTIGSVPLTWNASPGATSYKVYRAATSGGPYTVIAPSVAATSYTDTTAVPGTSYYYVITAVGPGGESGYSGEVTGTPAVTPAVPTGLSVTQGYIYPELSWNAVPFGTTYTVKRGTVSGGPYTTIASGLTTPSYADTTALNLTTYFWVVTASNVAGQSLISNQVTLAVNVASFINVTAGNWNAVTWIPSPPGQPAPSATAIIDFQNSAPISSNNNMGTFALNKLRFLNQTANLTGNTLNFSGTAPTVTSGVPDLPHSIANATTLSANTTFDIAANALTVNGIIGGSGSLYKTGNGTLNLGGANSYTGSTYLNGGILNYSANNSAVKTIFFGDVAGGLKASTLSIAANVTALALTTQTDVTAGENSAIIGAGKTLTINGALTMGGLNGGTAENSHLTITGAGSLVANFGTNASVRRGSILDLSALGSTSFTGTNLNVGDIDNYTVGNASTLILPANGPATLNITNLNLDTATAGGGTSRGESATFLAPPGSGLLTIRGATGGVSAANLLLDKHAGSGTGTSTVTFDTRGHQCDIVLASLEIGRRSGSHVSGDGTQFFYFDSGTLSVANVVPVGFSEAAASNTATLTLEGGTITFSNGLNLASNSGNNTTTAASATFTIDGDAAVTSGPITMAALTGATASRTSTAAITLLGGRLTMTGGIVRGDASGTGTASASITLAGGVLDMQGNPIGSAANPISELAFDAGTLRNIAGINGGADLVKDTTDTLTLEGTNTYTTNTVVNAGTLNLAPDAQMRFAIGSATSNKLTGAGEALLEGNFYLDLSGAAPTDGKTWTLADIATSTYATTFGLKSTLGDFIGTGGVWILVDGGNTWTYTAATGVLSFSVTTDAWTGSTGNGTWANAANWSSSVVPGSGGTARFRGAGGAVSTIDLGGNVTIQSLLFDTPFAAAYIIGSGAPGSQTLTLNDGGSIQASNTIGRNQTINAALVLGTDGSAQSYSLVNNDADNSLIFAGGIRGGVGGTAGVKTLNVATPGPITISGPISNGGATSLVLTKTGTGTLTLTNTNTYSGQTTVTGGTLQLTGSGVINPTTGATLSVGQGAVGNFQYDSSGTSKFGQILVGNGAGSFGSTLNQTAGTITVTTLTLKNGFTTSGAGNVNLSGGTMTISGASIISSTTAADNILSTFTISGSAILNANGDLRLTGNGSSSGVGRNAAGKLVQNSGTVNVAGTNGLMLTQGFSVSNTATRRGQYDLNGGTLNVNKITSTSFAAADAVAIFNFNGGTLTPTSSSTTFWANNAQTTANVRNGGAVINTNGRDITISQPLLHSSIAGDAAIDGGLTKTGTGTLTLQGINTFTGPTTISAGKLALTGTFTTSISTAAGTLAPQGLASTTGNVAVTSGGSYEVRLNGSTVGTQYDQLTTSGTVTLGGALSVIIGPNLAPGSTFTILNKTSTGAVSGTFTSLAENSTFTTGGFTFRINYIGGDGNDIVLTLITTPIEQWRFANFGSIFNTGNALDTADNEHDGNTNLLEYAMKMNPLASDTVPQSATKNTGAIDFVYTKNKSATDITYTVEWSDTLLNDWSNAGVSAPTILSDDGTTQQIKVTVPAGAGGRRFVHLRVMRP